MEKEIVCINCPLGCRLVVETGDNGIVSVCGQGCKRGSDYARQEALIPMRVLTGIMKAQGCPRPFSVRTDNPVPRELLIACAQELKRHQPSAPVSAGDVVIQNILGTGSNVVATQDLPGSGMDII